MRRTFWIFTLLLGSAFSTAAEEPVLHDSIADLRPFLGTWEIESQWSFGAEIWAKGEYRPAMDGRFVEVKTWVSDNDGPVYLRYRSMIGVDPGTGELTAHSFGQDGSYSSVVYERTADGRLDYQWKMGETTIKERLSLEGEKTRWQVWSRADESGDWQPLLDGMWRLTEPFKAGETESEETFDVSNDVIDQNRDQETRTATIDDRQFVASGADVRRLELTTTIQASASEVFAAFTDGESFVQAYGPDRAELAADIELAIGGRYEWLFDGKVGSNGCQVLSYVPDRWISFTWNAPPTQAENREKRTWVVVELAEKASAGTEVRLTHLGFGEGPDWDETYAYFEQAWQHVLSTFKQNLDKQNTESRR